LASFSYVARLNSARCRSARSFNAAPDSSIRIPQRSIHAPPFNSGLSGSSGFWQKPMISPTSTLRHRPCRAARDESHDPNTRLAGLASSNARCTSRPGGTYKMHKSSGLRIDHS
jgi:hypothetical protein